MKLNKAFTISAAVLLLTGGYALGTYAANTSEPITAYMSYDINVNYDGENVVMKNVNRERVFPVVYQGTTYIPIRAMGNLFHVPVDWDGTSRSVLLGTSTGSSQQPAGSNSQTYGEQIVKGYYPGVEIDGTVEFKECQIKFSSAIIEEKSVMVREAGSGGEPLGDTYKEKTVTFIKLQPKSTVEVPPNPYSNDPYDSEALSAGGGTILENGYYDVEWAGGAGGFSSGTAEEIVFQEDYVCMLDTDQFGTDYCFIVMGH